MVRKQHTVAYDAPAGGWGALKAIATAIRDQIDVIGAQLALLRMSVNRKSTHVTSITDRLFINLISFCIFPYQVADWVAFVWPHNAFLGLVSGSVSTFFATSFSAFEHPYASVYALTQRLGHRTSKPLLRPVPTARCPNCAFAAQ
jgi:hypothetical protein